MIVYCLPLLLSVTLAMSTSTASPTLYFGYGSNMWREQMSLRCPNSIFEGIGRLDDYEWIINDRGYANVVASSLLGLEHTDKNWGVWGMIYMLTSADEERLDSNEGVPHIYGKELLDVNFWSAEGGEAGCRSIDVEKDESEKRKMLVYVDYNRTTPSKPKEEYIYRMNQGVADAVKAGIPEEYVKGVVRKYIPEEEGGGAGEGDGNVRALAEQQARKFEDE